MIQEGRRQGQHMRVGIEVGGTFTDLVAVDGSRVDVAKVPSTPASPDIGAFAALGAAGIAPAGMTDLVHGSTVATNAILERKGARVAFVTTAGFRDILFLQRHDRRNIYDLRYAKPRPPVARRDCFEVAERIDADGQRHRCRSTRPTSASICCRRWPPAATTRSRSACSPPMSRRRMSSACRQLIATALPRSARRLLPRQSRASSANSSAPPPRAVGLCAAGHRPLP